MVSKRVSSLSLCVILLANGSVFGVPVDRRIRTLIQPDGTVFQAALHGDEFYSYYQTMDGDVIVRDPTTSEWLYAVPKADGSLLKTATRVGRGRIAIASLDDEKARWSKAVRKTAAQNAARIRVSSSLLKAPVPRGNIKGVLLLVNFSDTTTNYKVSDFNDLMNATGYSSNGAMGSVKDYYLEASYGQLTLQSDVYGWFSVTQSHEYYGKNGPNGGNDYDRIREMVKEAIAKAEPNVNFADYDSDGDGWVDMLGIVHQGLGEKTGTESDIWSHAGWLEEPVTVDDVSIRTYYMVPECLGESLITIGVFCHEIGHVFGLPDLYDLDYSSAGVGNWSVMGYGSDLGPDRNGAKPCHFDPWCKYVLGWITPEVIYIPQSGIALPRFDRNPTALLIPADPYQDGEYFLVANRYARDPNSFDWYLPGSGALILHVDEFVPDNNDVTRKKVDVEEAGGFQGLDSSPTWTSIGSSFDLYPKGGSAFDASSAPNSRDNEGISTEIAVTNFVGAGTDMMTCDINPMPFVRGYAISYDSVGDWYGWGYNDDGDDYACVRFQTDQGGILQRVKTHFRYEGTTDYTVNVYSGWLNNKPAGLLTTQTGVHTGTGCDEILLLEAQTFVEGTEFIVEIGYNTHGGNKWPIPIIDDGNCSGRTYIRSRDTVDYFHFTEENDRPYDALIRANLLPLSLASTAFRLDVQLSISGGGSVRRTPDMPSYGYYQTVTLEAVPAPGYGFVGWSGDLVSTSNPTTTRMNRDMVVLAHFEERFRPDLVEITDAQYPPVDDLAPGSQDAQDRQRQTVEQTGLPLEVCTAQTRIVFRLVPDGNFVMGGTTGVKQPANQRPQHQVTLTRPFYCAKFEVTQGQWKHVMGSNPSSFQYGDLNAPVERVTWNDCNDFVKRLCEMEGVPEGTYRFLTEAEWEYVCRAGTTTTYHFGDSASLLQEYAWYSGNSGNRTHPVGQKRPNAFGLQDLYGNVYEWCQDWYESYQSDPQTDPNGPDLGGVRVYRGGSLSTLSSQCNSAYRFSGPPGSRIDKVGLRLARTMPSHP